MASRIAAVVKGLKGLRKAPGRIRDRLVKIRQKYRRPPKSTRKIHKLLKKL